MVAGFSEPRHAMDGISWTDLDADEQRVIAMLADGVSCELCDPVALLTLKRIGFIKGFRLTLQAEQMLAAAVRRAFAAYAVPGYRADSNRPRPTPARSWFRFCPPQEAARRATISIPDSAQGGLLAWGRS